MLDFWKSIDVADGESRVWQAGCLRVWLRFADGEWRVAAERSVPGQEWELRVGEESDIPEGLSWDRWLGDGDPGPVQLLPLMPDRPLVVHPVAPIHIMRGHRQYFYVSIPVWISLLVEREKRSILELPSQVLSNTWFGDTVEGELCYSLGTRARREPVLDRSEPLVATCRVVIMNNADEPLHFERLCLRAEYLTVYQGEAGLFTNDTTLEFNGQDKPGALKYGKARPNFAKDLKKLGDPRRPIEHNLLKRSFSSLIASAR
jgi:hypothetical protein